MLWEKSKGVKNAGRKTYIADVGPSRNFYQEMRQ